MEIDAVLGAKGILIYASDQSANPQDNSSIILRNLLAVLAEDERQRIVKRLQDGMKQNALQGMHNGGTCPYGYQLEELEHTNPAKKKAGLTKKRLAIDPATTPIVREIFENYCFKNMGLREVRDDLNRRGAPSPKNGPWARSSIRAILRNPKYTGYQVWGRQRRVKEFKNLLMPSAGEVRKKVWNPPEEWTWSQEPTHEAIIPKEWFAKVDKVAKNRASSRVGRSRKNKKDKKRDYLFRGLIRCDICGRRLQTSFNNNMPYYRCLYKQDYGYVGEASKHPDAVYLRGDKLEEAIEKGVDPVLVGGWIEELKQEKKELKQQLKEEMNKLPTLQRKLDIEKVLEKIPDMSDKLKTADPAKKRKLLEAFRLQAKYDKNTGIVKLQVELSSALSHFNPTWSSGTCRWTDSNRHEVALTGV